MVAGLVGKSGGTLFYGRLSGGICASWSRGTWLAPNAMWSGLFEMLTYRQKTEEARDRMIHDALTGLYNRGTSTRSRRRRSPTRGATANR